MQRFVHAPNGFRAHRARRRGPGIAAALLTGILLAPVAAAQPAAVGRDFKHDVSRPLREIRPIPPKPWTTIREMPEPRGETIEGTPRPPVTDPVAQRYFTPGSAPTAIPSPSVNFDGVGNINGVYPPDTNGDVGPNHYVQWVNLSFQIFDKTGVSLFGPAAGNTLWSGFGGPCETRNDGDIIVLYDPIADRWLMSQFAAVSPFGQCVAVSQTPDPTGAWYRYFFQLSTTVFYDYPKLGVWPDGYYMSANRFTGNTANGPAAIVLQRSQMLLGLSASFQEFHPSNSGVQTYLPSDLDGSTLPPSGSPNYYAHRGSTTLDIWKFHVDWATPANSTFTGPTSLAVAAYNQLCPGTRSCIPQPGTSVGLDGLGDRLMHRLAYRNFGDHESLVVNHAVDLGTTTATRHAGVRWYEVRNAPPGATPTLYQQGTYAPDAVQRWMGSVAMDGAGNMALGYSVSDATSTFPGIRYTGRLASDTLGTMPQGEATVINGSGSQTGKANRWGDYAMMTVDPTDDCTFWFTTEYMPSTGTAPWKTRIASFKFPSCAPCSPPPAPTASNNGPICAGGTLQLSAAGPVGTYSWTGPNGFNSNQQNPQVLSAPVSASGTYSVTVTVGGCTSSAAATSVLVRADPSASITAPSPICPGSSGAASVPSAGAGATYAWTIGNGMITSGQGTAAITFTAGTSGSVSLGVTVTDGNGCASNGSTNVSVSTAACPGRVFSTVTPCRVLDTRNPNGPYGGPALAAGGTRTFVLAGQCGIPANASSVAVNVTITAPTAGGFLTIYPAGSPEPLASTINYSAGQTRANNAILTLGASGDVTVACGQPSGTVQFILDVTGYFQ